ncbi:aromatic ring-hydroxylating oxygenase subunit alpha [Jannaschia ovalis]|uniref:Aromatic ring-hydroxylating dioxygenase subunit alpha n=1 Tax=Jannaschia ovalis TaxID=3038773 RepID=A0ABY8LA88_9RHOB|nr:aromatic ring-hydroxylating dioxygenase subunit alpha [Jannaschia sp. GRR-S6-38]WGH78262.1 aromatic ring-hydroxylating dioxygenase subunit alpha [Jannaschia sp. GRR-S6-38]
MKDIDALAAVRQPIGRASGLPNAHYTDAQTIRAETAAILHGSWAGIGVAAQVPQNGDAVPIDFAGAPLLLLRDRAGRVRVFQNVCRHRGMILVSEPRRIEGAIRCPYHSWCYSTEGRLVATPHVGGPGRNSDARIDRDGLGLIEVAAHVWRDVVFVNLDGTAPPFPEVHAAAIARWAEFDQPLHHDGRDFELAVACNWKLAVENYCESYHLPWIHPGLNAYSRLEDHYHIEGDGFSGQGTSVYRQLTDGATRFPDFDGLPAKWDRAAEYLSLFPNVLLGTHRDHAFAIVLMPDGPDRTREQVHFYYATPDPDVALADRNAAQWRAVFEEDLFVVEGMQRGRAAPGFDGGRFSPAMDGPTHAFHDWVAAKLGA